METVSQLAKKALELKPVERIQLVEEILCSLDKPDSEIKKHWIDESETRFEAYKKGEIEAIEWDVLKEKYER